MPVRRVVGHACHSYDVRVTRGACDVYHKFDKMCITETRKLM